MCGLGAIARLSLVLFSTLILGCTVIDPPLGSPAHESKHGEDTLYTRNRHGDWDRTTAYSREQEQAVREQRYEESQTLGVWHPSDNKNH